MSLATAGIGGTFTIQARDQYYNLRGANAGLPYILHPTPYTLNPKS